MRFGTIGAGAVALGFAREALRAGHQVVLSNRRGPDSLGDDVGKGVRATPVAQHHLMAGPQGFSREPKRDRARTDRSEPHDAAPRSLEKLKRTTPFRPGRPTCATASPIRDGR